MSEDGEIDPANHRSKKRLAAVKILWSLYFTFIAAWLGYFVGYLDGKASNRRLANESLETSEMLADRMYQCAYRNEQLAEGAYQCSLRNEEVLDQSEEILATCRAIAAERDALADQCNCQGFEAAAQP